MGEEGESRGVGLQKREKKRFLFLADGRRGERQDESIDLREMTWQICLRLYATCSMALEGWTAPKDFPGRVGDCCLPSRSGPAGGGS